MWLLKVCTYSVFKSRLSKDLAIKEIYVENEKQTSRAFSLMNQTGIVLNDFCPSWKDFITKINKSTNLTTSQKPP